MTNFADWVREANHRGSQSEPFLFLVDFEMLAARIFPPDTTELALAVNGQWITPSLHALGSEPHVCLPPPPIELEILQPPGHSTFHKAFDLIRGGHVRGQTWLANLTFKTPVALRGHRDGLRELAPLLKAPCVVWHQYGEPSSPEEFLCFTPESFIEIEGNTIRTRPMKGTRALDPTCSNQAQAEEEARLALLNDEKELAEHITVVDLLRNDIGSVADTVHVPSFRYVERLDSGQRRLLSTSSLIEGTLPQDWKNNIGTLLSKLLPAGSVSGAPKQRTVELIRQAEESTRGYYTGVVGWFNGKNLRTWVLIRFLHLKNQDLVYQSGVGLTLYSDPTQEYQEVLDKIYLPLARAPHHETL